MQVSQVTAVVLGLVSGLGYASEAISRSQEEMGTIRKAFSRAFALASPGKAGGAKFVVPLESQAKEEPIVSRVATEAEAYHFADYGSIVYCGDARLQAWDCKQCKEQYNLVYVANDPRFKGRALIVRDSVRKEIVLVFRGSHNIRNWLQNFVYEYSEVPYAPGARVHKGFWDSSNALVPYFLKALASELNAYPGYRFAVVGHSLGGSQAIIGAIEVHRRLKVPFEKISVFTFGQPRTGNVEFARYVNSLPMQVTRVVNENDMVPHSIPEYGGFAHHGTEMLITNNASRPCSNAVLEDPTCSKGYFPQLSPSNHFRAWDLEVGSFACLNLPIKLARLG